MIDIYDIYIFFWGGECRFFNEHSEEKNYCAAEESGIAVRPPQWVQRQSPGKFVHECSFVYF